MSQLRALEVTPFHLWVSQLRLPQTHHRQGLNLQQLIPHNSRGWKAQDTTCGSNTAIRWPVRQPQGQHSLPPLPWLQPVARRPLFKGVHTRILFLLCDIISHYKSVKLDFSLALHSDSSESRHRGPAVCPAREEGPVAPSLVPLKAPAWWGGESKR